MKILKNFFRFFAGGETICGLLFHLYVMLDKTALGEGPSGALGVFIILFFLGGGLLLAAYVSSGMWVSGKEDELGEACFPYLASHVVWWLIWILIYISPAPTSW